MNINALKQSNKKELKDQMMEGVRILDEYTKEVLKKIKEVPVA